MDQSLWSAVGQRRGLLTSISNSMRAQEFIHEVNAPNELTVPDELIQRFTSAGWQIVGEGQDQIVLSKPNSRYVLKIVGQGSGERIDLIRQYVNFYRQHQRNPHFPRVGGDRTLRWEGKTYYAYTQELLKHLPGNEAVLDYLEYAMGQMGHGEEPDFNKIPKGLSVEQVEGLMYAVDELFGAGIGDVHQFDLGNVYNIMQRDNGQLVIVDPFAGWDDDEELSESVDPSNQRTAELLVRELEVELADYYDASRGTSPAAYRDQVRRRIAALNQELQGLGFKYAPTAPGKVAPLGSRFVENFADGKVKGKSRPGRVKRAGASCKGSVSDLRARAKKYGGERGKMYHWCANMKSGRKK